VLPGAFTVQGFCELVEREKVTSVGIVPTVAALVQAHGPAVTFTRFVAPAAPTSAWHAYYEQWPFALQPPDSPLWDVVPELTPPGPTVDAPRFSKWGAERRPARTGVGRVA